MKSIKVSNFRLIKVIGTSAINWKFKAVVDVTTKAGIFRKKVTEEREVYRAFGASWRFTDTGEATPGFEVEQLEKVLEAEKEKEIQYCL
jgi:hypothetical protein